MSVELVRERLVELFLGLSEAERKSEITRQVLCERKDFSPQLAFHFIAPLTSHITVSDIKSFMLDNDRVQTDYDLG